MMSNEFLQGLILGIFAFACLFLGAALQHHIRLVPFPPVSEKPSASASAVSPAVSEPTKLEEIFSQYLRQITRDVHRVPVEERAPPTLRRTETSVSDSHLDLNRTEANPRLLQQNPVPRDVLSVPIRSVTAPRSHCFSCAKPAVCDCAPLPHCQYHKPKRCPNKDIQ